MTDEELVTRLRMIHEWKVGNQAADRIEALTEQLTAAQRDAKEAEAYAEELQQTFDMQWKADQRAIKMWQEAHPGNDLVWPDGAKLSVWLMERIEALTAEVARVKGERDDLAVKLDAVVSGDWSKARLVRFENGQFDFAGGPVAFIAEYLSQVMEAEDGYHNNMEARIDHPKAGPMVLTLQRVMGLTPADQRKEAITRAEKAEAERDAAVGALEEILFRADSKNKLLLQDTLEDTRATLAKITGDSHE